MWRRRSRGSSVRGQVATIETTIAEGGANVSAQLQHSLSRRLTLPETKSQLLERVDSRMSEDRARVAWDCFSETTV